MDDLHGALAQLEARLLAMEVPNEDEIRAGSLGACLLSVLLFQAVRDKIARDGLPRPICVMAGSNGVYPYFDAPVAGMPEHALKEEAAELTGAAAHVPGPRYSSLLVTGIPRARKRAVLVVEETETETAARIANLRGLHHRDEDLSEPVVEPLTEPVPELAEVAEVDDGTIVPNPNGPLMVKRKPSHAWDFRDLLTTEPPSEAPEDDPEDDFGPPEPPQNWLPPEEGGEASPLDLSQGREPVPEGDTPQADAPGADLAEPAEPDQTASTPLPPRRVEPGFTSFEIDLDIESRLKALIAAQVGQAEPAPVTVPEPEIEPEAITGDAVTPDLGPAWPLGIGWLEEEAEPAPPAPRPSLLARILNLLPWRR